MSLLTFFSACRIGSKGVSTDAAIALTSRDRFGGAYSSAFVVTMVLVVGVQVSIASADVWNATKLHATGMTFSFAYDVSDGQQVGKAFLVSETHAGLWTGTAASWVDLNPAGATLSVAYGAGDGQQVGYVLTEAYHASHWSGTSASWVDLNPAGATESKAFGVDDGQQVGYATIDHMDHASLWSGTSASWVDLSPAGSLGSYVNAVHNGYQVGFVGVGGQKRASLWNGTAESWVNLDPNGSTDSVAIGVSDDQQVGYALVGGEFHASLWSGTASSWVDLSPAGATWSTANAVSGGKQAGSAVVGDLIRASVWSSTAASWEDLSEFLPPGYSGSSAQGIWNDGNFTYVAGYATNSISGRVEAMLWTQAIPEPGVATLLGLGTLLATANRRRTRCRGSLARPCRPNRRSEPRTAAGEGQIERSWNGRGGVLSSGTFFAPGRRLAPRGSDSGAFLLFAATSESGVCPRYRPFD